MSAVKHDKETSAPETLGETSLGYCVKVITRAPSTPGEVPPHKVVYQNKACIEFCGDRQGTMCTDGCMKVMRLMPGWPELTEGAQVHRHMEIDGKDMDVVLVHDAAKNSIVTMLYPRGNRSADVARRFEAYGLSPRELEVMRAVTDGFTRAEICEKLMISKATLKTHLNNLYRKLPEELRKLLQSRGQVRSRATAK